MPQRQRIDLAEVAAWPNLGAAMWLAASGKRSRPDVAAFLSDAPPWLAHVQAALLAGHLRSFTICDPKLSTIHAAPLADRVAHHAIVRLMEPRLERALVRTSFACLPGKGVHAAIAHAQVLMRAHPQGWTLQLDLLHCFPSIGHAGLLALLARRFKGSVLGLLQHLLAGHASVPGRGLPIGSLTSRHLANQFLGELARAALAHLACLGHVRYMDDIVLWCAGRVEAQALLAAGAGRRRAPRACLQHAARTGAAGGRRGAGGPTVSRGASASTPPASGCCGAGRGSTTRANAGRPSTTPAIRPTVTPTSASGWPERFPAGPRRPSDGTCQPCGLRPRGSKRPGAPARQSGGQQVVQTPAGAHLSRGARP